MERSSCEKIRDMLFEYLDNELNEADREKVDKHIEKCEDCRKELEMRRKLINMISDSAYCPKADLASAFIGDAAILGDRNILGKPKKLNILRYGTVAAAAVLMATVALSQGMVERFIGSDNAAMESASGRIMQEYDTAEETVAETYAFADTSETTAASVSFTAGTAETYAAADNDGAETEKPIMFKSPMKNQAANVNGTVNDSMTDSAQTQADEVYTDTSDTVLYSAKQDGIALRAEPHEIMSAWLSACIPDRADSIAVLYVIKADAMFAPDVNGIAEVIEDDDTVSYIFADEAAWNTVSAKFLDGRAYEVYRSKNIENSSLTAVIIDKPIGVN